MLSHANYDASVGQLAEEIARRLSSLRPQVAFAIIIKILPRVSNYLACLLPNTPRATGCLELRLL